MQHLDMSHFDQTFNRESGTSRGIALVRGGGDASLPVVSVASQRGHTLDGTASFVQPPCLVGCGREGNGG